MKLFRNAADKHRIQVLRTISLFRELTDNELLEVDGLLHERVYQQEEIIFDEGDLGLGLFIVVSGRVKALPHHELFKAAVLEFGPGDFFGELSLFDDSPRTAQTVALEETRVVALFRNEFFALLQKNKNIGVKILFELCRTVSRRARQLLTGESHRPCL